MTLIAPVPSRSAQPPDAAATLPPSSARISFRQPVSSAGHIDGAWWPRTSDLAAEVPALLDLLWTAARDINRVTYCLGAWAAAPRSLDVEGRAVRLGGFATSDPLTVRLSDPWGRERVDLLVVPPDTPPAVAERAMRLASSSECTRTAAGIMDLARNAAEGERS